MGYGNAWRGQTAATLEQIDQCIAAATSVSTVVVCAEKLEDRPSVSRVLRLYAMARNASANRKQSRKPPKAHTHDKRQPTNAGQQRCASHTRQPTNQAAAHASIQDTTHTGQVCHGSGLTCPAMGQAFLCRFSPQFTGGVVLFETFYFWQMATESTAVRTTDQTF